MNSRGIIHESSLLRMNIIPLSIHNKFEGLLKSVGIHSGNFTTLGFWLQIYWNEPMKQVVDHFKGSKKQQAARYFHPTDNSEVEIENVHQTNKVEIETETPVNDEEWDEELINDIQGIL